MLHIFPHYHPLLRIVEGMMVVGEIVFKNTVRHKHFVVNSQY